MKTFTIKKKFRSNWEAVETFEAANFTEAKKYLTNRYREHVKTIKKIKRYEKPEKTPLRVDWYGAGYYLDDDKVLLDSETYSTIVIEGVEYTVNNVRSTL